MSISIVKVLLWTPRILAVLFILFVSMFALDVFDNKDWMIALIIHLIPSYILILLTAVAWKDQTLGGILYILAGVVFLFVSRVEGFVIYIPAIVLGILFLLGGRLKARRVRHTTRSL